MATRVEGGSSTVKSYYYYTVSSTDTTYSIAIYGGIWVSKAINSVEYTYNINGTGKTAIQRSGTRNFSKGNNQLVSSYTWSWTKTHSAQSVQIVADANTSSGSGIAHKTFTVPAKTSYTVTYNANGGSGAIANQTKWYGEALTLSTAKPTKSGYTFKGWATSTANASAGTVNYASGASYTSNAALTLYAVWELAYSKPSITSVSIERCDANGNDDDEGGYAKVNFDWSVFTSSSSRYYGGNTYPYADNTISSASVTVGTFTETFTASDTLPIIVGDGSFSTDAQYDASISITDSQSIVSSHTTTVTGTLATSFFPMDFNADGTAMGIFMPAPDDEEGVYIGKDLFLPLDTTASSGTDHDIYTALTSLGWDSDVIV